VNRKSTHANIAFRCTKVLSKNVDGCWKNFTPRVEDVARTATNQKLFQFYLTDKAKAVIATTATEYKRQKMIFKKSFWHQKFLRALLDMHVSAK
jgi:hypothetical protein